MSSKFVTAKEIMEDMEVSRSKAYEIIRDMNDRLKKSHPEVFIISGRVSRDWYNRCIFFHPGDDPGGDCNDIWMEKCRRELKLLAEMKGRKE